MSAAKQVASARLAGKGSTFRIDVLRWDDDDLPDDRLLVAVEIGTPHGSWRSRWLSALRPDLSGVASAAQSGAGSVGAGTIDYAVDEQGAALAFSFHLVPEEECVEVAVVVDRGLEPDVPQYPAGTTDTVLLRVEKDKVVAFAEALEAISRRDPARLAWAG